MSTDVIMTSDIHEQVAVHQPKQRGEAGGFLRRTNVLTGSALGIGLSVVTYVCGVGHRLHDRYRSLCRPGALDARS